MIRMWLVRFRIRLPLPRARGIIRLIVGPSPTIASFTTKAVDLQIRVVLRVGDRALQRLVDEKGRLLRGEGEKIERCRDRQTLNLTRDFAHLEGRNPRISIYRSNFHLF